MKSLIFICFLSLSLLARASVEKDTMGCLTGDEKVSIQGWLENAEGETVYLLKRGTMTRILAQQKVKDGKFVLEAVVEEPGFLMLSVPEKLSAALWAEPRGTFSVRVKDGIPVFEGDGSRINNWLAHLTARYADALPGLSLRQKLDRKRAGIYGSIYRRQIKETQQAVLSEREKRLVTGYCQGELLLGLYEPVMLSKTFGKAYPKPEIQKGYTRGVFPVKWLPEITCHSQWKRGLDEWLYDQVRYKNVRLKSVTSWLADLSAAIKDPKLREDYILATLDLNVSSGQLTDIREQIQAVRSFVTDPEGCRRLEEIKSAVVRKEQLYQKIQPGTDLSGFCFYNTRGDTVTLGDFRGKYMFIDLWSTGCNPCIGEIPYIRELEQRFEGKPIVWLSVSLDLHEKEWKDFLTAHDMKGVQLWCKKGFKNPFIQKIGVTGIPHFLLLDKKGCVIDYNTLRPSDPVWAELLELHLKE